MSGAHGQPDIVGEQARQLQAVVAAVIVRDRAVLICQRRRSDSHPLKWEFPGGKVEAGESPLAALERELAEELAVRANIGPEIARYEYAYAGRPPILLVFYYVDRFDGEPVNLAFEQMRWELPERMPDYDFLEGDVDFVRRLAAGALSQVVSTQRIRT